MATFAFRLPDVGEGLHEGEIGRWLVQEGDTVREDQPLVEVLTDKVNVELPAPVSGRVVRLLAGPGDVVPVGAVIVEFETAADGAPAAGVAAPPAPPGVGANGHRALATPAVRRVARELGVDIHQVPGTGPAGRVLTADVQRCARAGRPAAAATATPAAAATAAAAAATGQRIPLRGVRRAIAEAMVRSKHTAAHVTTVDEVDLGALVALREQVRPLAEQRGIRVSYLPFIIKALVVALQEFPYLNASLDDDAREIVLSGEYNIGVATDTDAGLLVPVVRGADRKSIFQIAEEINRLAEKARSGKLGLDEVRGGTFTVSNQGAIGAGLFFTPVINHPEVAILGVGALTERPVVKGGQVVPARMMYLSLSFDHRVIDGAMATRFLKRVIGLLANPNLLFMEMM